MQIIFVKMLGLYEKGEGVFSTGFQPTNGVRKSAAQNKQTNDRRNFFHYFDTNVNVLP